VSRKTRFAFSPGLALERRLHPASVFGHVAPLSPPDVPLPTKPGDPVPVVPPTTPPAPPDGDGNPPDDVPGVPGGTPVPG
jgi:hypothetical protein